jgi:hypothetical protein
LTSVAVSPASPPLAAAEVFVVRPYRADDLHFVMDSWLKAAWKRESKKLQAEGHGRRRRDKAQHGWFQAVRPHVTRLIEDGGTTVLVACERADGSHIGGWVAVREGKEYASYVKAVYRPWGLAELLKQAMEAL